MSRTRLAASSAPSIAGVSVTATAPGPERLDDEPHLGELRRALSSRATSSRGSSTTSGISMICRGTLLPGEPRLQALVDDPLVRGVLVDDDEAVVGLRHDVVGMELRASGAERARRAPPHPGWRRRRARPPTDGRGWRNPPAPPRQSPASPARPSLASRRQCRCRSAAARSRRAPQAGERQALRRRPLAEARNPCSSKRVADRADDQPAHHAGIAEADLLLRRVDVDVELGRIEFEEERRDRKAVAREHVSVGGAERAGEQRIAERASVHEQELLQRVRAMEGRQAGMTGEPRALPHRLDRHGVLEGTPCPAPAPRARRDRLSPARRKIERQAVVARKREAHARVREREPPHHLGDGVRLGAVGAKELQPGGRGEEEVAHLDLRADSAACRNGRSFAAAVHLDRPAVLLACVPRLDRKPRHRADRGERLAAEAERGDSGKIVAVELRRAVPRDRQRQARRAACQPRRPRRG